MDRKTHVMLQRNNSIETLYASYARRLYATSLRILSDPMEAEEAMHDTFLRYNRLTHPEQIQQVEHWLTKTCARLSIDRLRKRKRNNLFMEDWQEYQKHQEREPAGTYTQLSFEHIQEAIQQLPEGYRLILSLHLIEGFDYEEIATITQLRPSSIRSQYLRARKRLSEQLQHKLQ